MAISQIYKEFTQAHCRQMIVGASVFIDRKTLSALGKVAGKKQSRLPYHFASVYKGKGKEKIGASAHLEEGKKNTYGLFMNWFLAEGNPPSGFGKLDDFFSCLGKTVTEKKILVTVEFSYDTRKNVSFFKPIPVAEQSELFDEITGLTGVKKDTEGKISYMLEVSFGKEQLEHTVSFASAVPISANLPVDLLEKASSISALALRSKDQL